MHVKEVYIDYYVPRCKFKPTFEVFAHLDVCTSNGYNSIRQRNIITGRF